MACPAWCGASARAEVRPPKEQTVSPDCLSRQGRAAFMRIAAPEVRGTHVTLYSESLQSKELLPPIGARVFSSPPHSMIGA